MNPFLPLSLLRAIINKCKGRDGVVLLLDGIFLLVFDRLNEIKREIVCLSGRDFYYLLCQIIKLFLSIGIGGKSYPIIIN